MTATQTKRNEAHETQMITGQQGGDELGDHSRLVAAGLEAVETSRKQGVLLRSLGGVAVALRCPSAAAGGALERGFSDLDFATSAKDTKRVSEVMRGLGYRPHERFNASHGHRRLLFEQPDGRHVDIFVDQFSLCHVLPLRDRLAIDEITVPLADLLLTKLQVAKLARKDVSDAAALLLDHRITEDDSGLNSQRLIALLANDWGWWRTSSETLSRLKEHLASLPLERQQRTTLDERLGELRERIEVAPKSFRWRARARIGDRRPWREDPDELEA